MDNDNLEIKYYFDVEEIKQSTYIKPEKKKIWEHIFNVRNLLLLLLLFSIGGNLFQFFLRHEFDNIVKILFINKDNEFQWAGVTALIAIISLLATAITTIRKNRADLVSKSRIDWIQKVKAIMAEYLKDVHYYPYLFKLYKEPYASVDNPKIKIELDELAKKIEENHYLLLLNLSDNDDNKELNDCIINCVTWINSMEKQWEINKYKFYYKDTVVSNLTRVSRDYFKREWDRAKKGK